MLAASSNIFSALGGSVDAGTLRYQRTTATGNVTNQSHAVEFNHCVGRVGAYSGSFLVTREHLSRVDFSILQHLEGICMSTFGAADYGLKASDWHDFFINHISEVSKEEFFKLLYCGT